MRKVIKKGHESRADLKGKTIEFTYYAPWDDDPWSMEMVFDRTQVYYEDPRYPRFYVLDEDGGGHSFWEDEEVGVMILEDGNQY